MLVYELELRGEQEQVTLLWGSATGHLMRKSEQRKPSVDRQESCHL